MIDLSERQIIAARIADHLGSAVVRRFHPKSWRRKRFYEITHRGIIVHVMGTRYISVNQNIHKDVESAITAIDKLINDRGE